MFLQVSVILSTGGWHVWLLWGVRGCFGGCVVAPGGHAWLLQGVHGCSWGVMHGCSGGVRGCSLRGMHGCSGGMCGCSGGCVVALGGHAWLPWGGMPGCSGGGMCGCSGGGGHVWLLRGACVVAPGGMRGFLGSMHGFSGGMCGFFDEIRSMSGQYASYWNAFLCYRNRICQ